MHRYMGRWMKAWVCSSQMNGWIDGLIGGWMKARVCESQTNGWIDGDGRVDRWMMDRRMVDRWNGEMDRWMMGRYNIIEGKHYGK